jgi:2-polyprenyl-3-methyl-5-hydroxy-6-metoxy-1,4-benzoquinol methylase
MPAQDCPFCSGKGIHRFNKNSCKVYQCDSCASAWAVPVEFDPQHYYGGSEYFSGGHSDGYADYEGSEAILRSHFRELIELLKANGLKPNARILELGSAFGFFLAEAEKEFEAQGIEISEAAAKKAVAKGLKVQTGTLETGLFEPGFFDAVVMWDTIEHLEDPMKILSLINHYLAPNGIVAVTTGDWGSVLARVTGKRWRLMTPPQHLFFFTEKGLQAALEKTGFRVKSSRHLGKKVPLGLALFQVLRGLRLHGLVPRVLSRVGIRVNLFDSLLVVGKKSE